LAPKITSGQLNDLLNSKEATKLEVSYIGPNKDIYKFEGLLKNPQNG
jgi:hypothetical protein